MIGILEQFDRIAIDNATIELALRRIHYLLSNNPELKNFIEDCDIRLKHNQKKTYSLLVDATLYLDN